MESSNTDRWKSNSKVREPKMKAANANNVCKPARHTVRQANGSNTAAAVAVTKENVKTSSPAIDVVVAVVWFAVAVAMRGRKGLRHPECDVVVEATAMNPPCPGARPVKAAPKGWCKEEDGVAAIGAA